MWFFSIFLLKNCSVPNKFLTVGESGRSMSNAPSVGKTPHCGQVLLEVNVVHPCSESVFGLLNSYRALCRAFDFWQGWWDAVGIGKLKKKKQLVTCSIANLCWWRGRWELFCLDSSGSSIFFPGLGVRDVEMLLRDEGEHWQVGRRK